MLHFYLAMLEDEKDKIKFESIYQSYKGMMTAIATQILHNKEDTEEAVQDSFLKIIFELEKINLKSCNKTRIFIAVIVRHTCYNIILKKKRSTNVISFDELDEKEQPTSPENELPLTALLNLQSYELLKEKISRMDEIYSSAIVLTYEFGYSDVEIARILSTTPQNIRVRLSRAKQILKKLLAEA